MIIIAHRGNLDGSNPDKENHPDYIVEAIKAGFNVEIDVWNIDNKYYLGHDEPQYEVTLDFLSEPQYWLHCKNIKALHYLVDCAHCWNYGPCFYHNTDDAVLTSHGWLWTYPGKEITNTSIAVMPETVPNWNYTKAAGVCTDFPRKYQ